MIVIIRICGQTDLRWDIIETLDRLRIQRKLACTLIDEKDKIMMGMLKAVDKYVAYGEIDDALIKQLILKRGELIGGKKVNEKDVDKITRLLVDQYYETDDTPKTHNIVYLDIECVIAGALTEEYIKDPKGEITAIALYDHNSKKYFCLVLDKTSKMSKAESEDKIIMPYPSEKELLSGFLDKWYELDPTIITGWNSGFFDIPYLYYRIKKVLGEPLANSLSPINKIHFTPHFPEQPVNLAGINHLDYMLLFKKYIMKQEPSYRLGDIGKKYAKLEKIEYQGSLDKLFKEDPHKFIDYTLFLNIYMVKTR